MLLQLLKRHFGIVGGDGESRPSFVVGAFTMGAVDPYMHFATFWAWFDGDWIRPGLQRLLPDQFPFQRRC